MAKNRVTGVSNTIRRFNKELNRERNKIKRKAQKVSAYLLKEARGRAPVLEGTLIDSMTEHVTDKGRGNGFKIEVTGGDTPYAHRMHEANYQAHPRSDYLRRTSKKTGKSYYVLRRTIGDKSKRRTTIRGKFWIDSRGRKHGRKYMDRTLREELGRVKTMLRNYDK